jgi:predicted molibdopterin-dependent oxidoreductase YjgC
MQNGDPPSLHRNGRIVRVARWTSPTIAISIDGETVEVPRGQSILASILSFRATLRTQTVSGEPRAGFCLMGACQECWLWLDDGRRVRACTTTVEAGMAICTTVPPGFPQDD